MASPGPSSCHHRKRTRAELGRPLPFHVKCDNMICSMLTAAWQCPQCCSWCSGATGVTGPQVEDYGGSFARLASCVHQCPLSSSTCRWPQLSAITPGGRDAAVWCMMPRYACWRKLCVRAVGGADVAGSSCVIAIAVQDIRCLRPLHQVTWQKACRRPISQRIQSQGLQEQ